jgi:xanthine dehydrogenase accessory factor
MLITSEGETIGTIGGGGMERLLVKEALEALNKGRPKVLEFALGIQPREGMIPVESKCGGEVRIFMDVIKPTPRIIIMGSGVIAQAVARYANECGFEIILVDDSETARPEVFPFAKVINDSYPVSLKELDIKSSDYILMLHGETDFELHGLRYAVKANPYFIGLLGSKNKAREHKKQLLSEGYLPDVIEKIVGPVGLEIGAETPEEIGISIVAQLINIRHG